MNEEWRRIAEQYFNNNNAVSLHLNSYNYVTVGIVELVHLATKTPITLLKQSTTWEFDLGVKGSAGHYKTVWRFRPDENTAWQYGCI